MLPRLHLRSGSPLMMQRPMSGESSVEVCRALDALFVQYGVPMVIKEDNGSAFRSDDVKKLIEKWGVIFLMSPPHYPVYNRSVESGISTMNGGWS